MRGVKGSGWLDFHQQPPGTCAREISIPARLPGVLSTHSCVLGIELHPGNVFLINFECSVLAASYSPHLLR